MLLAGFFLDYAYCGTSILNRKRLWRFNKIGSALDQHWTASASGDLEAEHDIYDDNVVCEYPQSGEKIRGRRNLQALRGHHPGKPSGFTIRRIIGTGDLWVTEYDINYEGKAFQTVSIMEFKNGKVIHETQYFAEPFNAPAWRAQWVEKKSEE